MRVKIGAKKFKIWSESRYFGGFSPRKGESILRSSWNLAEPSRVDRYHELTLARLFIGAKYTAFRLYYKNATHQLTNVTEKRTKKFKEAHKNNVRNRMNSSDYVLENYIADSYKQWRWVLYHSHLNAEFYVKHPNIYVFVDVLKKIQQTAYVSMNRMSQRARISKYTSERKQRLWCLPTTIKLKFHRTDTDSNTDTRILVRKSACPATSPFSLPQARHARQSSPTCPPTRPTRAFPRVTHVTSSMRFYTLLSCGFIHYLNAFSSSINAFS